MFCLLTGRHFSLFICAFVTKVQNNGLSKALKFINFEIWFWKWEITVVDHISLWEHKNVE